MRDSTWEKKEWRGKKKKGKRWVVQIYIYSHDIIVVISSFIINLLVILNYQ